MIRWISDTCNCIIDFDPDTMKITNVIKKCGSHDNIIGTSFEGSPAQLHNSTINKSIPIIDKTKPSVTEINLIQEAKRVNFKT